MVVGGEITVDLFVAHLISRDADRFWRNKYEVDYLIGRAVICKGCGVV